MTYLFFPDPFWERAEPATDLEASLYRPSLKILDAVEATFVEVCLVLPFAELLFAIIITVHIQYIALVVEFLHNIIANSFSKCERI